MGNLPNHIDEALLAKYFSGEANKEEKDLIEEWANSSPENREELILQKVIWEDLGTIKLENQEVAHPIDLDKAWTTHQDKRQQTAKPRTRIKPVWIAVAASLWIIGALMWLFAENHEPKILALQTTKHTSEISLYDGSLITLNQNSELLYPEVFSSTDRRVELTGEAFFDIKTRRKKPFIVTAGEAKITVLGTAFNVYTSKGLDTVTVFVEHGKVKLQHLNQGIVLTQGEKGMWIKGSNQISKVANELTGIDQFWKTKTLTFSGQSLVEIVEVLKKAYGKSIKLDSEGIESCSLHVTFKEEDFEEVIEVISATLNLEVLEKNAVTVLKGQGCD